MRKSSDNVWPFDKFLLIWFKIKKLKQGPEDLQEISNRYKMKIFQRS